MEKKTKKQEKKVVASMEVICYDDQTCDFSLEGERSDMIPALATLLLDKSEDNHFHHMMNIAIRLVLHKDKIDAKKKPAKKATKKAL